jgi:hypothetical protein
MNRTTLQACILVAAIPCLARSSGEPFALAVELAGEGDHELAAVEFRRFALAAGDASARADALMAAAWSYLECGRLTRADDMLDRAEGAPPSTSSRVTLALLRAETARRRKRPDEALYFLDDLESAATNVSLRVLASRHVAAVHLGRGATGEALRALDESPRPESAAKGAIRTYTAARDKKPVVGGLLGLVPGLGYAYSGEYANGLRCLILNGLFIFGMVHTAENDDWGAFSVISFFELTWYSGSIYGGLDAAHRHNRNRLERCIEAVEGDLSVAPDYGSVPLFRLNVRF